MKTPEEMAKEYVKQEQLEYEEASGAYYGFLAGYKAAKDEYKVAIDTYNDVAKQMIEEAVRIMTPRDQQADADKMMCSTMMEEIKAVDTGELMPITNLPTSAKWISVKDRLPKEEEIVLTVCDNGKMFLLQKVSDEMFGVPIYWKYCCGFDKELEPNESYCYDVTHWQPLPAPPKEEK